MRRFRGPRRLRTRVTLVASVVALAMMSVAAVAMLAFQQRQLFDAVDVALKESVIEISSELEVSFERFDPRGPRREEFDLGERVNQSSRSLQLLDADGHVRSASGDLTGEPALIDPASVLDDEGETVGEFATVEGERARYRVAATEVDNGDILVVGYSLADVDESLETQTRALVVTIPLLSALLGLLIWLVLGRALRPVELIREEVASIGGQQLDRRVPVPDDSIELAALATTMNDMLDRLDASARRQRAFVSDAAHELRSPLAGIRGQLEVNIHHPEAPERPESERAMLAETVRMQELVDNLLLLARADHRTLDATRVEVDLDDLVLDEAAQMRRSTDRTVHIESVSAARVLGDPAQLRRVIRNLGDNAARHAAGNVWFDLGEDDTAVHLSVTDDGPGIPKADAESVFDRFTRLDESRHRDAGGSGLGLAISREIVEHHGGTIAVDPDHQGGARLVMHLPRPS